MRVIKTMLAIIIAMAMVGCTKKLSEAEVQQVLALKAELQQVRAEIVAAEQADANMTGGLLKVLIAMRLEVQKRNAALIQERVHAIESGATVKTEAFASAVDALRVQQLEEEIGRQDKRIAEADGRAKDSGGLIGAMAHLAVATERNSGALLRQQYLTAKYGLALPQQKTRDGGSVDSPAALSVPPAIVPAPSEKEPAAVASRQVAEQVLLPTLLKKQFSDLDYREFIALEISFSAVGLDKPARAVKGVLQFQDLFGERKFSLNWTINKPIVPGQVMVERDSGFNYNKFVDAQQWVRTTAPADMKLVFQAQSILYADGTTRDLD